MKPSRTFKREAIALLIFMILVGAAFGYMWTFAGGDVDPIHEPYKVQAVVPSAVALATHADVRQAGVRIGEVSRISNRGANAVLMLELKRDHAPVYRDARVLVRTKTLVGENYVDLDPGSPRAGRIADGGVLTIGHAGQAVQFDQVISTFDARRRRDLQRLLRDVGRGVAQPADLNRFLDGSAALVRESAPVNQALDEDRRQVAGLVDDFGRVTRAIGDRGADVQVLTRRSKQLAEAVAARDASLRDTLDALPGFLRQTRGTTTSLGSFALQATPVVRDLRLATEQLVPATRLLRPAAVRARTTMHALRGFTREANPLAAHLSGFARATAGFAPQLASFMRELNPIIAYLLPYRRDLTSVFSGLRSSTESYDALGHYARTLGLVSRSDPSGALTPDQKAAVDAIMNTGVLSEVDTRGINPYPKPGTADKAVPFSGEYPRVTADPPYVARP